MKIGGKNVWEKEFKDWKAANFGIGGDRTQHVLWRLQNGELERHQPQGRHADDRHQQLQRQRLHREQIADGVTAIVKEIPSKSPKTKVLLLGIFPRQKNAEHAQRKKLKEVNEIIAKLDDGKTVKYLDIGDKFLEKDGTIAPGSHARLSCT